MEQFVVRVPLCPRLLRATWPFRGWGLLRCTASAKAVSDCLDTGFSRDWRQEGHLASVSVLMLLPLAVGGVGCVPLSFQNYPGNLWLPWRVSAGLPTGGDLDARGWGVLWSLHLERHGSGRLLVDPPVTLQGV